MQFDGTVACAEAIEAWTGKDTIDWFQRSDGMASTIFVRTLEGTMNGGCGWWIIKGVKGEFYPCKPDIFETTYEAVT